MKTSRYWFQVDHVKTDAHNRIVKVRKFDGEADNAEVGTAMVEIPHLQAIVYMVLGPVIGTITTAEAMEAARKS